MTSSPPPEEEEVIIDQEKLSDEALQIINSESFQMRKAIDENKLRHSLKYAKNMLDTLKNPFISPRTADCFGAFLIICSAISANIPFPAHVFI